MVLCEGKTLVRNVLLIALALMLGAGGSSAANSYILDVGDGLTITVWGHNELNTQVDVRPDGYITFPLVGDSLARGLTPEELAKDIQSELDNYVVDPRVTVLIRSFRTLQVQVLGEVQSPGYYSLHAEARLMDAIGLAGGPNQKADLTSVTLTRTTPSKEQAELHNYELDRFVVAGDLSQNPRLLQGDVIYVGEAGKAVVLGEVRNPGSFTITPQMTVVDLLVAAGGMLEYADQEQAVLTRTINGEKQESSLNLLDHMAGRVTDSLVEKDDILFIPRKKQVIVLGEVKSPGTYPLSKDARLLDVVGEAGGLSPLADSENVVITRSVAGEQTLLQVNAENTFAGRSGGDNPQIMGGDIIFVPEGRNHVLVLGQVRSPGSYLLKDSQMLLDILAQAGGPSERGALERVTLTRGSEDQLKVWEVNAEEIQRGIRSNVSLEPGDVIFVPEGSPDALLLGEVGSPGNYRVHGESRLLDVLAQAGGARENAGNTLLVTREGKTSEVDLGALTRLGLGNQRILPGDVLYVPEGQHNVLVLGEVRNPGYHRLSFGDRVLDGIGLAGGLLDSAEQNKVTLTRQQPEETSVFEIDVKQLFANEFMEKNRLLAGGDIIFVPKANRRVLVLGEVRSPGYYLAEDDTRVLDLIASAGGATDDALLTEVRHSRDGEGAFTTNLDLSAVQRGEGSENPRVVGGDVVFVPRANRAVLVFGEVNSPGYYVAEENLRVLDLVAKAGGATDDALLSEVRFSRAAEDVTELLDLAQVLAGEGGDNPRINGGDVVYIPRTNRSVLVLGEVRSPGYYRLDEELRLLDVIAKAQGPTEDALLEQVRLTSQSSEKAPQILDAKTAMDGSGGDNPQLNPGDVVFVPRGNRRVLVFGEVRAPGYYRIDEHSRILDIIAMAGGLTERANDSQVSLTSTHYGDEQIAIIDLGEIQATSKGNLKLLGGEVIVIPEAKLEVLVMGEAHRPGMYTIKPGERVLDILARAGGPTEEADLSGATITKDNQEATPIDLGALLETPQKADNLKVAGGDVLFIPLSFKRVLILGEVHRPGAYDIDDKTRVLDLVATAGGVTGNADLEHVTLTRAAGDDEEIIHMNLQAILENKADNPLLAAADVLYIPEARQVLVMGEVNRPGSYILPSGGRILDLLALAGGLKSNLSAQELVMTRQGVQGEQVWMIGYGELVSNQADRNLLLSGGDVLFVPETNRQVLVLGEVARPGAYSISEGARVLDALALAGGHSERAALESVGIYRGGLVEDTDTVTMGTDRLLFQGNVEDNPLIQGGDIIYVPETNKPDWGKIFGFVGGLRTFQQLILGFLNW